MYSLCSISLLYRTRHPREITPADALALIKAGEPDNLNGFPHIRIREDLLTSTAVVTTYWGAFKDRQECMDELKQVPKSHFQNYLEGETSGVYRMIWEGVLMYEDGRPVLAFDSPYGGR